MTHFQQLFYDIKKTNDYETVGEDVQYRAARNPLASAGGRIASK